jgi:hypothetical protein
VLSLPKAARTTIAELIIGACWWLACHAGFSRTDAAARLAGLPLDDRVGSFSAAQPGCGTVRGIRREVTGSCFAIIDDTLALRSSAKAPGTAMRFDHVGKTDRPKLLLCQSFVTQLFPAAIGRAPCRSSPACRSVGKVGKLAIAKGLLRAVGDHFGPLYLLLDAWDMRLPLIRAVSQLGRDVIGQVRRDTTLFRLPSPRMPGDARRLGQAASAAVNRSHAVRSSHC